MKNLILGIIISLISISCSNQESSATKMPLNPNGDSELALLMREMFDDGMRIKTQIKNGEIPEVLKKFETIHTASATEPEKANSPEFKAFADSYLIMLENLETAEKEKIPQLYNGLVESCMNCHRALCPGPMVRIKKLYIEEEDKN